AVSFVIDKISSSLDAFIIDTTGANNSSLVIAILGVTSVNTTGLTTLPSTSPLTIGLAPSSIPFSMSVIVFSTCRSLITVPLIALQSLGSPQVRLGTFSTYVSTNSSYTFS